MDPTRATSKRVTASNTTTARPLLELQTLNGLFNADVTTPVDAGSTVDVATVAGTTAVDVGTVAGTTAVDVGTTATAVDAGTTAVDVATTGDSASDENHLWMRADSSLDLFPEVELDELELDELDDKSLTTTGARTGGGARTGSGASESDELELEEELDELELDELDSGASGSPSVRSHKLDWCRSVFCRFLAAIVFSTTDRFSPSENIRMRVFSMVFVYMLCFSDPGTRSLTSERSEGSSVASDLISSSTLTNETVLDAMSWSTTFVFDWRLCTLQS